MESGELEPSEGQPEPPASPDERARRTERLRRLALKLDTQPTLLTATDRLRRRLPGDDRFGDPLSTAGVEPVSLVARGVSALQPRRKSLAQELGLAGLQVWQSLSEATGRGHGELEMAILFTDLTASPPGPCRRETRLPSSCSGRWASLSRSRSSTSAGGSSSASAMI